MNVYIGTSGVLKNAYIGGYKQIKCDFTIGDYGFTWYGTTGSPYSMSYGRENSHGLYLYAKDYVAGAWSVPQSIYSEGTLKKIELDLYSTQTLNGGGIGVGTDGSNIVGARAWRSQIEAFSSVTIGNTPAGGFKFIVDLENKEAKVNYTSTVMQLDDNFVTTFRSQWSNGNINIWALHGYNGTYGYAFIEKATFYF